MTGFMLTRNNPVAMGAWIWKRDLPYCKKILTEAVTVAQIGKHEFWTQGYGEEMERRGLMRAKRVIG